MYQTKSKTKRFVAGLLGASLALSFAFAVTVKADTVSDLTAQINSLLATISSLQAKLATVQTGSTTSTTSTGYTFSTDLTVGSKGADVMNLQKVLNMSTDTQVASGASAGAPGYETSTFGPATKAAVMKFQAKHGISPVAGYVGAKTRVQLNSMSTSSSSTTTTTTTTTTSTPSGCTSSIGYSPVTGQSCAGSTTTTTTAPAGTGLTVSSPVQPAVTIAPNGASRVPFTKVTLTAGNDGDVTVNSLTVQRTGLAQDAAFSSIVLVDEKGLQVGTSKTFNSNHQTTVGDPFVIPKGTSKTFTIAGNMPASGTTYAGQVASLTVVGVNTSATVSGSLPITGAAQTINSSLTLGTATLAVSQYDPTSALTKNIGDTAVKFSGVKVTAGSAEDVTLWSIRWNQTGSAGSSDLANLVTVLDGTSYPTVASSDGKYYTTLFPNGIVVQKGFSKDMYIQGDIVGSGSSNRTVEFDLYNASDLYLTGNTYNFGILGTATAGTVTNPVTHSIFTASTPFYRGSVITISAGTVTTIGKSTTAGQAGNIAVNVPNQILGAFDTNIKGEPVSVQSSVFHFLGSTASLGAPTSVSLVDKNGSVVAGPVDTTVDTSSSYKATFTDTVTYPVGVGTYTIVGKLPSTWTNGTTIIASTTPSSDWGTVKGQITGNTLTLSNAVFSMNTMTIRTASLAVAASGNPAAQTVVAGSQAVTFTNFQFDATQSGEDVRIATVPTTLTYSAGAGTDISSCQLFDGATALTTGSNVVNPTTTASPAPYTFTLDQSLTIPKGTVKTISVKCNVSSSATAFVGHWDMTATQVTTNTTFVITGTTSTGGVTATGSAIGAAMSVGSASLAVSADSSSPSYTIQSAGTTGVTAGVYKFRATNDSINLQRVVLRLTNAASSSDKDLLIVHLFDGSTEVGSATFTGGNMLATSTLLTPVLLTRGTDKLLTAKIDLASIGGDATTPIPSGHLIAVDVENSTAAENTTYGTGVSSGTAVNAVGSTAVAGIRVFKSFPSFASDVLPSGVLQANTSLLRFKVTADSKGPIGIAKFVLSLSTSSVTISGLNIFAFTDSGYSQPVSGVNTGGQLMQSSVSTATFPPTAVPIYAQSGSATTTLQIPAGATRYFEVRATTVTPGTAPYSVSTTVKGDTAYPLTNATTTSFASSNIGYFMTTLTSTSSTNGFGGPTAGDVAGNSALNNFIWSPNSTTTSAVSDVDWTNGFSISGLPSNGISASRSNTN